jgi:hypothetical protein
LVLAQVMARLVARVVALASLALALVYVQVRMVGFEMVQTMVARLLVLALVLARVVCNMLVLRWVPSLVCTNQEVDQSSHSQKTDREWKGQIGHKGLVLVLVL